MSNIANQLQLWRCTGRPASRKILATVVLLAITARTRMQLLYFLSALKIYARQSCQPLPGNSNLNSGDSRRKRKDERIKLFLHCRAERKWQRLPRSGWHGRRSILNRGRSCGRRPVLTAARLTSRRTGNTACCLFSCVCASTSRMPACSCYRKSAFKFNRAGG